MRIVVWLTLLVACGSPPAAEVAHDINQFHAAGQERLELVGITRAPDSVRRLARLQPIGD